MGVPIPGSRPLALHTEQVRAALKGATITDVALIDTTRKGSSYESWRSREGESTRALEVTYRHGTGGRGRSVFYDRCSASLTVQNSIREWAEKVRRHKPEPKLSAKAKAAGVAIRRLEKEKAGICVHRPVHPLLQRDGYHFTMPDGCRESEFRWHEEKPIRKRIAKIAGLSLKCRITNAKAYAMLREAGFEFKRFSDLRKWDRDRVNDDQAEYWRHLHFFVEGVLSEPRREGRIAARVWRKQRPDGEEEQEVQEDAFERHAKARVDYLVARRQAASIDLQIAALKELGQ